MRTQGCAQVTVAQTIRRACLLLSSLHPTNLTNTVSELGPFTGTNHTFFIPQAFVLPSALQSAAAPADVSVKTAVDKAPASRADFLRSAGVIASTAAGAALLPKPSSAEDFTDDVLGFKFQVQSSAAVQQREGQTVPRYDVYVRKHGHCSSLFCSRCCSVRAYYMAP